MADDKLQLQEESLPSLLDADAEVQEIPTIEVTQDTDGYEDEKEEVTSEIVDEKEEDKSELISPKKGKKIKFGKVLKGKIKVPKPKGKNKKSLGKEAENGGDDVVLESSKVIDEDDHSEMGDKGKDTKEITEGKDPNDIKEGKDAIEVIDGPEKEETDEQEERKEEVREEEPKSGKSKGKFKKKFGMFAGKLKGKNKKKSEKDNLIEEDGSVEIPETNEEKTEEQTPAKQEQEEEAEQEEEEEEEEEEETPEQIEKEEEPEFVPSEEAQLPVQSSQVSDTGRSAREARKLVRQKLLEKMEKEGKIRKQEKEETEKPPERVQKRRTKKSRDLPSRSSDALVITTPETAPDNDGEKKRRRRKRRTIEEDGGVLSDPTDDNIIISNTAVTTTNTPQEQTSPRNPTASGTLKKFLPNKKSKGAPELAPKESPSAPTPASAPAPSIHTSPALRQLDSALSIKLHYAEHLYPTLHLLHPLVRVTLVDSKSGKPLPSTLGDERFTTIQPVLSSPFDLVLHKTMSPCWEEALLVPEPYTSVISNDTVLLFEIVDIVPARAIKIHKTGWNLIAWGFLKLKSGQGGYNTEKKLRLQLYKYPIIAQPISDIYIQNIRMKYPSTLYVTISELTDKQILSSLYVDQISSHNPPLSQYIEQHSATQHPTLQHEKEKEASWSRAPGQICKIPQTEMFEIPTPQLGCLLVAFSSDGRKIACGCVNKNSNPILVYSIPECSHLYTLTGHLNIVYDLAWHRQSLLSASSDCTARVWRNGKQDKQMSHPSFVYTAKWVDKRKVITGSYDKIVRVWDTHCAGGDCAMVAQLHGHMGHVNSLVLKGHDTFYSGDSKGMIIEWNGGGAAWSQAEIIHPHELKEVSISLLLLHPNKRRMFVQSRDSHVRLLDLRIRAITQRYSGHSNTREHIRCTVSPCGTYLFSASEDGDVFVWVVETGEMTYTYKTGYPHSSSDVKYHPHDNYLVITSFGSSQPITIYKRAAERDVTADSTKLQDVYKDKPMSSALLGVSPLQTIPSIGLLQSTPLLGTLSRGGPPHGVPPDPGMSITLSPGITQISGIPRRNYLKLRVLHDYTPARSDEIALVAGTDVKLIYMDTAGWWVGENGASQQGYFPANHVTQPTQSQTLSFRNDTANNTPRAKRKIDFNMSMTNGEKEWQTFNSTMGGAALSPGRSPRVSDNESVASSTMSTSRRRHTSAKVGTKPDLL